MYWQEQIHAPSARELVGDQPGNLRVAIIAGRPRSEHPALTGVEITTVSLEAGAGTAQPDDYTTALAALIAGTGGEGFEGVAPGTSLLALSVLDEHLGTTNEGIAAAVDRAVLGGGRVICLALGSLERSKVVDEAIVDAIRAGVVVVVSAGNSGNDARHYPAASEGVLAVGAVDQQGYPTSWTTRGSWVQVMAPGYEMALPVGDDGYAPSKGTAWSCAIASGVVALLLKAHSKLTPAEVMDLVIATGQPVRGSDSADSTIINAHAAVRRAIKLVESPSAEQVPSQS
jgi:thermitase